MVIIYSVSHVYCLCYISLNDYFDKVGVRQNLLNWRIAVNDRETSVRADLSPSIYSLLNNIGRVSTVGGVEPDCDVLMITK